jgi:hypothetical protein
MLFYIRNLSAESVYPGAPWDGSELTIPNAVTYQGKSGMIKWANDVSTKHMFFSAVEGESGALRVSRDNPAYKIHGVVADYDSKISESMLATLSERSATEFLPNYMSRTFSGGARLVWLFEEPVIVAGNQIATSFFKTVAQHLRFSKLLPGLDAKAMFTPTQYYEQGYSWKALSTDRIRSEFVWKWMSEAGDRSKWPTDEVNIPLDAVREQIEKEYPGAWRGPLTIGTRSRRFWDKSADNETAAVVRPTGFQCFTGPVPFMPWSAVLGEAFVKRYDADRIGKVLNNIYYDDASGKYWFQDGRQRWVCESLTGISRLLRTEFGLDGKIPKGGTFSEVDKALLEVQKFRRVDAALPFIHHRPGVIRNDGRSFLNTAWAKCINPAPESGGAWGEKFPWIARYLQEYLINDDQLYPFLAWWRHAYTNALKHTPRLGHALFFIGPQNCGKTLMNQRVIGASLGGAMDARSFLVEGNQFSGSCLEHPVLSIDDSTSSSDARKHLKYSAMIKAMVANPQVEYNQKFRAAGQVFWYGRILVSLNDDVRSLQMIPDLEQSLLDKIMLFQVQTPQTYHFPDNYTLEKTIERELPWALRWLIDWEVPEELKGDMRFGVIPYQNPELFRQAVESDYSSAFLDVLDLFLEEYQTAFPQKTYWEGSAAQLLSDMNNCERVSRVAREFTTRQIGLHLRSLAGRDSRMERVTRHRRSYGHLWRIPLKDDIH